MKYVYDVKELQAQPTASIRERAVDVGAVFGRLLAEVLTDPSQEPDPSKLRTENLYPVRKRRVV